MKMILSASLVLGACAHAQVVECPHQYPAIDTVLPEAPPQNKGRGLVAPQRLSGAGLNVGEFGGGGDIQGLRKDFKGGYEVRFGIWPGPKWLVCDYGTDQAISWWLRLDEGETDCMLRVVKKNANGKMEATITCK
jgi:hypothetical protein